MRLCTVQCSGGLESEDPEVRRQFEELVDYFNAIDGWDKYVRVHIYTIDNAFNNWVLYPLSIPVVHVGIHIEGFEEFTFNRQGIIEHRVGGAEQAGARIWTNTARIGEITISKAEILSRIDNLRDRFAPGTYRLLSHNCVTFVSAVTETLGCRAVPRWSQRMASSACVLTSGVRSTRSWLKRSGANVLEALKSYEHADPFGFDLM